MFFLQSVKVVAPNGQIAEAQIEDDVFDQLFGKKTIDILLPDSTPAEPPSKELLSSQEAADYLGVAKSTLYKYAQERLIPRTRPTGKMSYYRKEDLDAFLSTGKVKTMDEINKEAFRKSVRSGRI